MTNATTGVHCRARQHGGVALVARAQQPAMPVIGLVHSGQPGSTGRLPPFSNGLSETGYVEGQNVTIEYHWLAGQFDRLPALMADLVRRGLDRHARQYGRRGRGQSCDQYNSDRIRHR